MATRVSRCLSNQTNPLRPCCLAAPELDFPNCAFPPPFLILALPLLSILTAFEEGPEPLLKAALAGDAESVRALLAAGAAVDAADCRGRRPLMCAAMHGHVACVRALLEAGADPEAVESGRRPLHYASLRRHVACVRALLAAGADFEAASGNGRRALHFAAEGGEPATIVALLRAGADVDAEDTDGKTPLELALDFQREAAVQALMGKPPAQAAAAWTPAQDVPQADTAEGRDIFSAQLTQLLCQLSQFPNCLIPPLAPSFKPLQPPSRRHLWRHPPAPAPCKMALLMPLRHRGPPPPCSTHLGTKTWWSALCAWVARRRQAWCTATACTSACAAGAR